MMAVALWLFLATHVSDARLAPAATRIEKDDADGLRRLLARDPSLVKLTGAGPLPEWRWTLLHRAASAKASLDVVRALVESGADVNAQDHEGRTPLYVAAACNADPSVVEILIRAGADMNLQTFKSAGAWTPLHAAAAQDRAGIATVLLKYGAKMNIIDTNERTPTRIAERSRFEKTTDVLRAYATARALNGGPVPNVYVPPAAALSESIAGVVEGRVLWNEQPVAGATVSVKDDPRVGPARTVSTTTDDQGRFSIAGIAPGYKYVEVGGDQRVAWISGGEPLVTSEWSTKIIRRFNQDFHVCKTFDLGSPAQNESVDSRPVLRWDAYPDAGYYLVDVFDRTSSIALEWVVGAGVTSFQIDSDLPPGIYQWRVEVVRPRGIIACSRQPREFVVHR